MTLIGLAHTICVLYRVKTGNEPREFIVDPAAWGILSAEGEDAIGFTASTRRKLFGLPVTIDPNLPGMGVLIK